MYSAKTLSNPYPTEALSAAQQVKIDWQTCLALASRSMVGNYVYVLIFLTLYWANEMSVVHPDMMFYLGVGMVLLCIFRGFLTLNVASWQSHPRAWKTYFYAVTLCITSIWSGMTVHHWAEFGVDTQTMMLLLVVMGITFGALPVLSLHPYLFRSFAVVLYIPLIIFGYVQNESVNVTIASILLIGMVFSFFTSVRLSKEFIENLALTLRMRSKEQKISALIAQLRAESAAKSTFLANMSHEIRTPMNGVMGMTSMLNKTKLSEKQVAYVKVIQRSGNALLSIINDILDYSKMESGNMRLEPAPFGLRDVMDDVMALMAHQGMDKGLEVISDISPEVPNALIGDAGRIRQMLINLMGNAIKFTQEGEVRVSIATERVEENIHWVQFSVLDTGIGIPEKALDKIFASFSQADNSTTRRFGGTGLGLAICHQLTELMQGKIHVSSTVGEGSCFSFIVPLQLDHKTKQAPLWDAMSLRNMAKKMVLVVDDNHSTREALCHQLSAWNIKYSAVGSATAAWEIMTKQPKGEHFSIALLGMHMSGINGLDLCSMIRAHHDLSTMRLVMLCSHGNDAEDIKMSSIYVDDYITKPIGQRALFQALSQQGMHPEEAADNQATDDSSTLVEAKLTFESLNILIAEDNPVNQQVLLAMLELLGCHVDVANNGLEVLSFLDHKHVDLILMDCHMPQMDGLEATRQIRRRDDHCRDITIVALTANAMPEDRERCIQAGMDDYLSKPFTHNQLSNMIKKYAKPSTDDGVEHDPCASDAAALLVNLQVSALSANKGSVLDDTCIQNMKLLQQPDRPNIVHKVMQMYLEDAPHHLQAMRNALPRHDDEALSIAAHTLKSSSANIGAVHLSEICFDIEQLSSQSWDRQTMLPYLQQAESHYGLVCQEIISLHLPALGTQAEAAHVGSVHVELTPIGPV